MRYETDLHRIWLQTLHELEALQARRRGQPAPLGRFDFSGPPVTYRRTCVFARSFRDTMMSP
jgi:hypothetical protein